MFNQMSFWTNPPQSQIDTLSKFNKGEVATDTTSEDRKQKDDWLSCIDGVISDLTQMGLSYQDLIVIDDLQRLYDDIAASVL